jgi:hypothetical protein
MTNDAQGMYMRSAGAEGKDFPAVFTMHCPAGPTNACVKHARGIETLFTRMFGLRVPSSVAPEGSQCDNCVNEAKTAGSAS